MKLVPTSVRLTHRDLEKAEDWYYQHRSHVENLAAKVVRPEHPGSNNPKEWTASNWVWFFKNVITNRMDVI